MIPHPDPTRTGSGHPVRIQRQRTKGWRMPEGAIYVGRPGRWGNPFVAGQDGSATAVVNRHRAMLAVFSPRYLAVELAPLRGHDLACWCPLTDADGNPVPCHADVLLELANR